MSTVVGRGPTVPAARVPAKVVLNALITVESGRAAAIAAVAEPSAGTVSESKVSKSSGLVMSTTISGERGTARGEDRGDGRVGHREHDDVAQRGIEVVPAEQLHGVAATARDRRDGLAHAAGTEKSERWVMVCSS